ncbi:uncharacterized protein LOC116345920 isoform X2 [Contarinia nasturtii]|uniref:uncharacterized protein LOC116345920 isoform X2 n=1 Tax=Contarinia nasturtii TaxID=265458 RepID=UPI0012D46318|nr:uncharacterized protein LOC116345920 isoform X2 [Contarinia nasturtii]
MFSRVPINPTSELIPTATDPHVPSLASTTNAAVTSDDHLEWWSNAIEEDSFYSSLPFDASESGLWNGRFVPPPPRPPFWDDTVKQDGITTCDLCTWALQDRNAFSIDGTISAAGELGWTFTLIIVSIISALLGAIIMVIVLRCKRINSPNTNGSRKLPSWWSRVNRSNMSADAARNITIKQTVDNIRPGSHVNSNSGVWTWLSTRRPSSSPIDQIGASSGSPVENHYTHMMDDAYSPEPTDEALYAELDRESIRSGNPSYQNTAYSQFGEHDMPIVSSAPSSAYYSDLSTTGNNVGDRCYEVVGMTHLSAPMPHWECSDTNSNGRRPPRLAAINESSVPSDYV